MFSLHQLFEIPFSTHEMKVEDMAPEMGDFNHLSYRL